nr:aldo/keto reductase [Mesorhizobium ventifaucium]
MDVTNLRSLGSSPLQVNPLSFGGATIGDLWENLDDSFAEGVVRTAYDAGIRLFDTAPFYGHGLSDYRIGHALRQLPRDSYTISTKVGRWLKPQARHKIDRGFWLGTLDFESIVDYSYDGIMRSVEQSYQRLATNRLDILLIHDVDVWSHGSRELADKYFKQVMDSGYRALTELRSNGDVKAIGVGVNEADMCARFAKAGDFDCMLLAGRYTLYEQTALEEFLPLCVEKNIGILAGGVFNSGILATGSQKDARYNYKEAPAQVVQKVSRIEDVCKRHNVPLAAAAIQFPLGHEKVSSVAVGMSKPERVQQCLDLIRHPIPNDLWAELKHEGLLPESAPVPTV